MNMYAHEQLVAEHYQNLQREVEQYRAVASLPQSRSGMLYRVVGSFGVLLIGIGTRLRQIELRAEKVAAV